MGELPAVPKPAEAESGRLPAEAAERESDADLSWVGRAVAALSPAGGPPWGGPALPTAHLLTTAHVLTLQRTVGNAAVAALLGSRRAAAGRRAVVQRQDVDEEEREPTPEERVDEQTFDGFSTWAEASIADADDACVSAEETSNRLASPYQHRLRMLIQGVVDTRNTVSDGIYALQAGRAAPALTGDPTGILLRLDEESSSLVDVTDAWDAVMGAGLFELLARIGEAQVARARALRTELERCLAELRRLERIAEGSELAGAFAQTGANAAISIAIAAITFTNPIAGLAVSAGAIIVQLSIDHFLGPSSPDAYTFTASGVSATGAALENLGKSRDALKLAGRRVGIAGAIAGSTIDVLETRDAIARYDAAAAQLRTLSGRIERISRELDRLRPLLQYPAQANALINGLRSHADTLRENGQVVLARTGQL